jgi:type VI protein secretion system component VasA
MDSRLLEYYTHELLYMHALALESAEQHQKIAARQGMQAGEIDDPYGERLVQTSSFVTARTQMRIDAAFPELMQPMLETVYPNYVRQTPSIGVGRLYSGQESGHLGEGLRRRLRLYVTPDAGALARQVESLVSATAVPVNDMLPPGNGGPVFGRGNRVRIYFR